ncbi:DUF2590 family protein [Histophilus somni]|uniref:DUF2590 family protein n=1 Tax=Histophilus somni TaxID=731 RepID=UPI00094AE337|nr:DUF2590 family protein [Histophilus somni]
MDKRKYIDLWIEGEDLSLDSGKQPILCDNRLSIAQDIKHALLESGLVTALIGERSSVLRSDIFLQMQLLIEEDIRLVPGTIQIIEKQSAEPDKALLWIVAETVEFGQISQELHYG